MGFDKYKLTRRITDMENARIASDIRINQKKKFRYDPKTIQIGFDFAASGLSIDEADENMRENPNFVIGYEKYLRTLDVVDDFFKRGAQAFFDGVNWESLPENDRQNEAFIQGYEDAMMMDSPKRR